MKSWKSCPSQMPTCFLMHHATNPLFFCQSLSWFPVTSTPCCICSTISSFDISPAPRCNIFHMGRQKNRREIPREISSLALRLPFPFLFNLRPVCPFTVCLRTGFPYEVLYVRHEDCAAVQLLNQPHPLKDVYCLLDDPLVMPEHPGQGFRCIGDKVAEHQLPLPL